jgi:hypothetical protein
MKDLSDTDVPESMAVVQEDGEIVYKEEIKRLITPLPKIDLNLPTVLF